MTTSRCALVDVTNNNPLLRQPGNFYPVGEKIVSTAGTDGSSKYLFTAYITTRTSLVAPDWGDGTSNIEDGNVLWLAQGLYVAGPPASHAPILDYIAGGSYLTGQFVKIYIDPPGEWRVFQVTMPNWPDNILGSTGETSEDDIVTENITVYYNKETNPTDDTDIVQLEGPTADSAVGDNDITWVAETIYDPATDAQYTWIPAQSGVVGNVLGNFLTNTVGVINQVMPFLDAALVLAEVAKILVSSYGSVLDVLSFLIDQVLEFLDSFKKEGIHFFWADANYHHLGNYYSFNLLKGADGTVDFSKQHPYERKYLSDEINTKQTAGKTATGIGFYQMDTTEAFDHFIKSFSDIKDPERPPTSEGVFAGGLVLYYGLPGNSNIGEILEIIRKIYLFFDAIFSGKAFGQLFETFDEARYSIAEATFSYQEKREDNKGYAMGNSVYYFDVAGNRTLILEVIDTTGDSKTGLDTAVTWSSLTQLYEVTQHNTYLEKRTIQDRNVTWGLKQILSDTQARTTAKVLADEGDTPDWESINIIKMFDWLGLDETFSDIEVYFESIKDSIEASGNDIEKIVEYIENQIYKLQRFISAIDDILTKLRDLADTFITIQNYITALVIEPQHDGIEIMKETSVNIEIPNSPLLPENQGNVAGIIGIVGSGYLFSFLCRMLTGDPTLEASVPYPNEELNTVLTNEDVFRQKFGFMTNDELTEYQDIVQKRFDDRSNFLSEHTNLKSKESDKYYATNITSDPDRFSQLKNESS